jgi:hypothetical protein
MNSVVTIQLPSVHIIVHGHSGCFKNLTPVIGSGCGLSSVSRFTIWLSPTPFFAKFYI